MKQYHFVILLALLLLVTSIIAAQTPPSTPQIAYHTETGQVSFIGTSPASPLVAAGADTPGLTVTDRAALILNTYAPQFGISSPSQNLRLKSELIPDRRVIMRRYQQTYNGIPVFGGELIINMTPNGGLLSMNGEASPDLSIATTPTITDTAARQIALQAVATAYRLPLSDLTATTPSLWIYDSRLIKPVAEPVRLVWQLEVNPVGLIPLRELVLVDAITGNIALRFNRVHNHDGHVSAPQGANPEAQPIELPNVSPRVPGTPDLATYTANNSTTLPGTLLCDESKTSCTNGVQLDADSAHTYAKEAYNFYWTHHARDSIDGSGMQIKSTVKYAGDGCNAFWNGLQMVYHASCFLTVDDVVGHELTHGVTGNTSQLFYYYQSGAINESFSDVWGEALDQLNTSGNDAPEVKWHVGEDKSGTGSISVRYMNHPPQDGYSPDRIQSPMYWKYGTDWGGVHFNSGVNNKAVYLMVDGGAFNGRTVTGIGWEKVLHIYYRVQTTLLVSGSNYNDLYYALNQACASLIGTAEITPNDCVQVKTAAEAVEMNLLPTNNFIPQAEVCAAGQTPTYVFFDDVETYPNPNYVDSDKGMWPLYFLGYATSGKAALVGPNFNFASDTNKGLKSNIKLPANAYLHFNHAFSFDYIYEDFDGGIVEYSTDSGASWSNAAPLFDLGQNYNGTVGSNPAFVQESHGYVSTRYDLSTLAGQNFRMRWRIVTDDQYINVAYGWYIDDIKIYTCDASPTPTAVSLTSTVQSTETPSNTETPDATDEVTPSSTQTLIATTTDEVTPDVTPTPESTATAEVTPTVTGEAELIVNGGFEVGELNGWVGKNLTGDKIKCNKAGKAFAFEGNCAFRFKGMPGENPKLTNEVTFNGLIAQGETLNFSVHINTKLPAAGKVAVVKLKYIEADAGVKSNGKDKIEVRLAASTLNNTYQAFTGMVLVDGTVSSIKVELRNQNTSGKLFVDAVSLTVASSPSLLPLP